MSVLSKNLMLVLLLSIQTILTAQVRDMVFIIKPNIHRETKEQFLEKAQYWNRWVPEFSQWLRNQVEGTHGSGFLYVDENGDNYIVTNKHVVTHAESADVIQRSGRDETVFEECPVIFVSDIYDIAVLTFPDSDRPFEQGLRISTEKLNDGDEVISAGYPGVNYTKETLWQFARGYVTNSQLYNKEIFPKDYDFLIQHSANIDYGNSGGPLLIERKDDFEVVGINTFLLSGRDNTFISIPSSTMQTELAKAGKMTRDGLTVDDLNSLEARCRLLERNINDEEEDRVATGLILSDRTVSHDGLNSFFRLIEHRSENEAQDWWERFFFSPWDTLREATGEYEFRSMRQRTPLDYTGLSREDFAAYQVGNVDAVRTFYTDNRKAHFVYWVFEYGKWSVSAIETKPIRQLEDLETVVNTERPSQTDDAQVTTRSPSRSSSVGFEGVFLGPRFGFGDNGYTGKDWNNYKDFFGISNLFSLGFSGGLFLTVMPNPNLGFELGVVYTRPTIRYGDDIYWVQENHNLVRMPVLFRISFPANRAAFYLTAGPSFDIYFNDYWIEDSDGNQMDRSFSADNWRTFQFSLSVSGGISIPTESGMLSFGVNYAKAMRKADNDGLLEWYFRGTEIQVGYGFRLN